jgi:hypothetical protein
MGLSSTPEEDAALLSMAVGMDQPPIDWIILHLPDDRYAAIWEQGWEGDTKTAVMNGNYAACAFVSYSLEPVKDYIRQGYRERYRNDRSGSYKNHIDKHLDDFSGWL